MGVGAAGEPVPVCRSGVDCVAGIDWATRTSGTRARVVVAGLGGAEAGRERRRPSVLTGEVRDG